MDLDDMKSLWSEMSDRIDQHKTLTNEDILDMIQQKYKGRARRMIIPEGIGALICFGFAGLFIYHFDKLESGLSQASGVLAILLLVVLPILSLRKMSRWVSRINVTENTYKQTILEFARVKRNFRRSQRYSYLLGVICIFIILPPIAMIWKGKDVFSDPDILYRLPFGILFVLVFVFFAMRFYAGNIGQIDEMLQELRAEDEDGSNG